MRFSTHGPVAAAMAASLASALGANPVDLDLPKSLDLSKPINAGLALDVDISHTTLLAGVVAHAAVGDLAAVGADVNVGVVCQDCYVRGAVNASLSLENVVPALRLDLSNIEVKLDLDVHLDAGVTVAVRLPIPETHLSLPLPELDVGVSLYLELVIGADTAIDVSAGVFAQLVEDAFLETNILDGKILDAAFNGLAVSVLPIEVRIGCTELLIDLKLRAEVAVKAEVELDEILPLEQLGLDIIPDIGAGIEVAAAVDLFEYIGLFCNDPQCPLAKESTGLSIAAAAKVNVEIEDLLDIPIELLIGTKLLSLPPATICEPSYPTGSVPVISATTPAGGAPGYPTGNSPATTPAPSGYTTTVVTGTQTFTATVCDYRVANCPGAHQTGTTIVHTTVYTTTCPAGETGPITGLPPAPTQSLPPVTVTKKVTTLVPCSEVTTVTPPGTTPSVPEVPSVPTTVPSLSTSTVPAVSTTAQTSPATSPAISTSTVPAVPTTVSTPPEVPTVSVPTTAPVFTPSTEVPSFPVATPSTASESCSTTPFVETPSVPVETPATSVPPTAPVVSVPPAPEVSTTAQTSPVTSPAISTSTVPAVPTTVPVEAPSYPVETPATSVSTTALTSPTSPPSGPETTVPVVPVEAPSYSATGGFPPRGPTTTLAVETYPVATPPAGTPPAAGSSTASYPGESTSATSPVGSASVSTPVAPTTVPYPTGPSYPTVPAGPTGANPSTLQSQPSASLTYPSSSVPVGYPTHTPVQVAGAAKMTTGAAGVVAAIMAVAALM